MSITLNATELCQWEAAVATWPTCQKCAHAYDKGSLLTIDAKGFHREPCPDCVAGRVPQPVYIVIEGEPLPGFTEPDGSPFLSRPARWRVPVGLVHRQDLDPRFTAVEVGEPCEIRARYWRDPTDGGGEFGERVLASAATVEVLPVYDLDRSRDALIREEAHVWPNDSRTVKVWRPGQDAPIWREAILTQYPVPGRHFVAVVTP